MDDVLTIEPIKDLLDIYTDKNKVFLEYLNINTLKLLEDSVYYEKGVDQLFIYDKIFCLDKSTLKVSHIGCIIYYSKNNIAIKKKSKYYISIDPDDFYIFYKRKLKKDSKKDFMISLLKIL